MRGLLATASTVLVAIGLVVAALAVAWQPPTYRGVCVAFTASFHGSIRTVTVTHGDARATAWVARRGDERYAVVVESVAVSRLSSPSRRQLLATVARRLGGSLVGGWFAHAPLQRGCGPPVRHTWPSGQVATAHFVGPA